jgi:hypothetical protein
MDQKGSEDIFGEKPKERWRGRWKVTEKRRDSKAGRGGKHSVPFMAKGLFLSKWAPTVRRERYKQKK